MTLDLRDARRHLELADATAIQHVNDHEVTIQRLHNVIYGHPKEHDSKTITQTLQEDILFGIKRTERVEKVLGVEPLTKENQDAEAGLTFIGGVLLTDEQINEFKACFARFDRDGSGTVGTSEVGDVLKGMGHDVPPDIVYSLVSEIDKDKSGEINFDEFCVLMSKMLGPDGKVDIEDMLRRMSETASREAMQQKVFEIVPQHTEELQKHRQRFEEEAAKISSTDQRVKNLQDQQLEFISEMRKLRQQLELNQDCWKGLSRGLKEAHRTVHQEGEGEMLPSAMRLRSALPPLGSPARPATHCGNRTS